MTARGLAPLRHRDFRLLVAGQLGSNVGDAFYAVALPWYVLATHGGALLLGSVLAAYGVARASLLMVGGHLSDRWRPWTVMMATAFQRWAPPGVMGRLAGLLTLASLGVFPVSVALAALVVHSFGPALFFPLAAATLAAALLAGLSQRTWRNFGAITPTGARRPDAGLPSTASTSTDTAVHA